eukprot:IDg3773t1
MEHMRLHTRVQCSFSIADRKVRDLAENIDLKVKTGFLQLGVSHEKDGMMKTPYDLQQ